MAGVNVYNFMAQIPDFLADKLHPQFLRKILSKKVQLIHQCLW